MDRKQRLAAVWKAKHRDYKGITNGVKSVLVLRQGGTHSVPLDSLTSTEIIDALPAKIVEAEVNRLASLATADIGCPVMKLNDLAKVVKQALRDGLDDDAVVDVGRKFLIDLMGKAA